jgi:hypothetical protein
MLKHIRVAVGAMMLVGSLGLTARAATPSMANLMTFDGVNGLRYFALSLQPSSDLPKPTARDVVILIDTSASQTGAYRSDSLEAATTLLGALAPQDRVRLAAIDLRVVELSEGFVAPKSRQTAEGLKRLDQRTPLGSTDLVSGLQDAAKWFDRDESVARHVVYIGDGVSHADWPSKDQFARLIAGLADQHVTITSYAIGPYRDVQMLVALANHTGGHVYVDAANVTGQQAGQSLASALDSPVAWVDGEGLERLGNQRYPRTTPPLRTDRDSIVIGVLPTEQTDLTEPLVLNLVSANQPIQLTWQIKLHPSSDEYSFLPRLIEMARADDGASLPTLSSEALREIRRMMVAGSDKLSRTGRQPLVTGTMQGATLLAEEVLEQAAANPDAEARQAVVKERTNATTTLMVQEAALELLPDRAASEPLPGGDELPAALPGEQPSGLLDEAMESRRLNTEFIKSEVARGLDAARRQMRVDPNATIVQLKSLREAVRQAPDLDPGITTQLLDRVDTALQTAYNEKVEKDHRDEMLRQNQAQAEERQRLLDLSEREEELIMTYIDQFNSRMDERRFELALDASQRALEVDPTLVATVAARTKASLATSLAHLIELRVLRQQAVLDTLYQVERSAVPFPDDPPLIYPDAETWQNLTNSRKKYAQIDYATVDGAEQRIVDELERTTSIEFFDEPLADAISYLEELHGIQIEVNQAALDELGIATDATVNKQLSGISLRSALKLMLRDLGLTYVIEDEVLQITTPEDAASNVVTKVYPVADLVLPIQSIGGGGMMGMGMMGGMGMGMGGMGMGGMGMGGMGMGGMGMGGMGMGGMGLGGMGGMGGMGGFWDVEDAVSLGVAKDPASTPAASALQAPATQPATKRRPPRAIKLDLAPGQSEADAWDAYFRRPAEEINEADVRETLRQRMNARHFDQVLVVLRAALRQGYVQPWMYEALSLAMQAKQAPGEEIERALMSAADLSGNPDEIMLAAVYLSRAGFDARALKLFREVADANPLRPEPYIQGLELANRLNDTEALQWAVTSILSQAWPNEQRHVQDRAIRIAEATLSSLKASNSAAYAEFRGALAAAIARDCEVKVTWTGDADIDVLVEEPGGTVCSLASQRTTSGGVLLGDAFAHASVNDTTSLTETYVCPKGFSGRYRMLVRRIWGDVTAGKVTVDVYLNRNTPQEKHIQRQIPLSDKDAMIVFDVEGGRRTEALKEHQIASVVTAQAANNRALLAQHLNTVTESEAVTNLALARARLAQGNVPFFPRAGAVGYQPQITTLPEGANMISANAVISADRRYVRFSPGLLSFSQIGEVQTFNFFTGETGTDAGTNNGTGGLGGLGGGF